jgi:hypothetical protein
MRTNLRTRRQTVAWLSCVCLLGSVRADEPVDLAGTWTWSWKDAQGETHRHVLEIEGSGSKLTARERFDDQDAVKINDLKVVDKKINFSVLRGDRRAMYEGTIAAPDTINGKITVSSEGGQENEFGWTATRQPVKK